MWWTRTAQGYPESIDIYQARFDEFPAIRAVGIAIKWLIQLPLEQSSLGN
jgi:hypothetical protein